MFSYKCNWFALYQYVILSLVFSRADSYTEQCYGHLGCLNITMTWLNKIPETRSEINTIFTLFNDQNRLIGRVLDADTENTILYSNFNSDAKTVFVIHGYLGGRKGWMFTIKDEILHLGNANVILVNWADGARSLYPQSAANTQIVGLEIAHLIRELIRLHHLKLEHVHLIGHSLGAHCAAFAGKDLPGISRITALDPAALIFEANNAKHRLSNDDAAFVDVIHTDSGSVVDLGMFRACGDYDFYPNNGTLQPGCGVRNVMQKQPHFGYQPFACSHFRSINIFIESIRSKCRFLAFRCASYEEFIEGKCLNYRNGDCAIMGYHAKKVIPARQVIGKYYSLTNGAPPFCGQYLLISLLLTNPDNSPLNVEGSLSANLYSKNSINGATVNLTPFRTAVFNHNSSYVVLVIATVESLRHIQEVELNWAPNGLACILFNCNKKLYVKSIRIESISTAIDGHSNNAVAEHKLFVPGNHSDYAQVEKSTPLRFYEFQINM